MTPNDVFALIELVVICGLAGFFVFDFHRARRRHDAEMKSLDERMAESRKEIAQTFDLHRARLTVNYLDGLLDIADSQGVSLPESNAANWRELLNEHIERTNDGDLRTKAVALLGRLNRSDRRREIVH